MTAPTPWVFRNDRFIPWEEATVHLMSHGLGRGSAVFEVLSFHDTPAGPAVFRLDAHLSRLRRTLELLDMDICLSLEDLHRAVLETIRRNALSAGYLKIIGYFPQAVFTVVPPDVPLDIAVFVLPADGDGIGDPSGVTAGISRWRKLDPRTVPVEAKVAAHYLNGMLARRETIRRGYAYAVLLDTESNIAEGATESVFWVRDGRLFSPGSGHILQSITRASLAALAEAEKLPLQTGSGTPEDLLTADEMFFASTAHRLLPVRRLEDRRFPDCPGPVTRRLSRRMAAIIGGRDDAFRHWLFPAEARS